MCHALGSPVDVIYDGQKMARDKLKIATTGSSPMVLNAYDRTALASRDSNQD